MAVIQGVVQREHHPIKSKVSTLTHFECNRKQFFSDTALRDRVYLDLEVLKMMSFYFKVVKIYC